VIKFKNPNNFSFKTKLILISTLTTLVVSLLFYSGIQSIKNNINYINTPYKEKPATPEITYNEEPAQLECKNIEIIDEIIDRPEPGDTIQQNIGYQNNKVGIYIYAEVKDYVDMAEELVNSNDGEWGYVLIPYNVKDYNSEKWFQLFELLKQKKLIPIVQLYDIETEDEEKIDEQIKESSEFLTKLPWPIEKRYVSVYNEPNDKNFWKGKIDPEGYAVILDKTIDELKKHDSDFFVMNAAFNASARTGSDHLDMRNYLIRMEEKVPGVLKKLNGWASHSYPQPQFSGNPSATGRDSIRAYEWELAFLQKQFGINSLPVFITETGWAHREGYSDEKEGDNNSYKYDKYQVADNIKYAYEKIWLPDNKVVAVTPFTIRFNPPHDHFSWITEDGNPMPQFEAVKSIKKTRGKPPVINYQIRQELDCAN
jgi:hypothetical protein